jgi:hypothetical protein
MPKANIHRPSTLEKVYPPDVFASDAAKNGRVPNTVLSGVRILAASDAAGNFEFERATQQIGEATSAAFLAPYCREDPRAGYEAFLADAAQRFGFKPQESPGRDEPRLRGSRQ